MDTRFIGQHEWDSAKVIQPDTSGLAVPVDFNRLRKERSEKLRASVNCAEIGLPWMEGRITWQWAEGTVLQMSLLGHSDQGLVAIRLGPFDFSAPRSRGPENRCFHKKN